VTHLEKREVGDRDCIFEYAKEFNPDIVITCGWMDRDYLNVTKRLRKEGVTSVMALDNHWNGSIKQRIASLLSPFTLLSIFDKVWVAGAPQKLYAQKLGFKDERINEGYYCADTPRFSNYFNKYKESKQAQFPRKFIYVGRYVRHKGIYDMWQAFSELRQELEHNWELLCLGTGELFDQRPQIEGVTHAGFVQPRDMEKFIAQSGVFILPSHFEPWGVSVQEFIAAGYPILLSREIGSSESFLIENENGYSFNSKDIDSMISSFKKIISLSEKELIKMQLKSIQLSLSITTQEWSDSLMSFKL